MLWRKHLFWFAILVLVLIFCGQNCVADTPYELCNRTSSSCFGSYSCVNTLRDNTTTGSWYCSGYLSCANAVLGTITEIECRAPGSCALISFIKSDQRGGIRVYAPFGLYGANIVATTVDDNEYYPYVNLYAPFAAYNTIYTCKSGGYCKVNCNNGYTCFGLAYICEENAECEISGCTNNITANVNYCPYLDGSGWSKSILKNSSIIYDKKLQISSLVYENTIKYANYLLGTYNISDYTNFSYDSVNMINTLNKVIKFENCNDVNNYYTDTIGCVMNCDEEDEGSDENINWSNGHGGFIESECFESNLNGNLSYNLTYNTIERALCFTGSRSGQYSEYNFTDDDNNYHMFFDGAASGWGTKIYNLNGDMSVVNCYGGSSCYYRAQFYNVSKLSCQGRYSCSYFYRESSRVSSIICGGYLSCWRGNFVGVERALLIGTRSGWGSNFSSVGDITNPSEMIVIVNGADVGYNGRKFSCLGKDICTFYMYDINSFDDVDEFGELSVDLRFEVNCDDESTCIFKSLGSDEWLNDIDDFFNNELIDIVNNNNISLIRPIYESFDDSDDAWKSLFEANWWINFIFISVVIVNCF